MNSPAESSAASIGPGVWRAIALAVVALLLVGARPARRETISLEIAQPPPEQVNSRDLWNITLHNPAPDTKSVVLRVDARASKAGAVFSASTQELTVPPGELRLSVQDITLSDVWCKKGYEAFAAAGSLLPEGDYTFSVTLVPTMKTGVLFLRVRVPKPLELVWPPDGFVEGDSQPLFAWRPPVMSGPKVDHRYVLSVVEVAHSQTAIDAIGRNRPVLEIREVRGTARRASAQTAGFESGKTYAWSVVVDDSSGASADSELTYSRASSFAFKPGASQAEAHVSFKYPDMGRAVTGVTSLVVESDVPDAELCVLEYSLGSDSAQGEWQVAGCFPEKKNSFVGMWGSDSAVIRAGRMFPSQCLLRATVLGRRGARGEALLPIVINPPPPPTRKGCGCCGKHRDK